MDAWFGIFFILLIAGILFQVLICLKVKKIKKLLGTLGYTKKYVTFEIENVIDI